MIMLISCLGAMGLVLIVAGLPVSKRPWMRSRVEPYVSGLRGRPSSLVRTPVASIPKASLARLAARMEEVRTTADLTGRLEASGRAPDAIGFRVEQLTWGIVAGVSAAGLIGAGLASDYTLDPRGASALLAIAFVLGFSGRDWWLGREISSRESRRHEELPIALDLIALSVMAGESVPAAFERVADSVKGVIGIELERVIADVRAGESLLAALDSLSRRVADPSMSRFVDALATGIEKGTPLAEVLRGQADDAREAKRRRLMELGGRKEVLMLVPVVFLIMPVVVVFALYPGLVSLRLLVP